MKTVISTLVALLAFASPCFAAAITGEAQQKFTCGKHIVEISPIQGDEAIASKVQILDLKGDPAFPQMSASGVAVSLCKQDEFLLLDTNTQYKPGPSYLFSEDGGILLKVNFGEVDDYGKSEDDKIFWVQSRNAVNKSPVVELQVYSYEGKKILSKTFDTAAVYSLTFQGKKYEIKIMQPDLPG